MTAPPIRRLFSRGLTRTLLTPHPVEHYVRSLGVSWSDDPTGATVVSVGRPVADFTVLTLRLPAGVDRPAPGAALEVGVVVDGVVHRRHYSPVDPADRSDQLATIAVRRHPGGVVSEFLWNEAVPGMRLLLGDAAGEMSLPESRPADILLISGGSGITPMLSIASTLASERYCLDSDPGAVDQGPAAASGGPGRVAWIHYARRIEDVPFRRQLHELSRAGVDVHVIPTGGSGDTVESGSSDEGSSDEAGSPDGRADGSRPGAPREDRVISRSGLSGHLTASHVEAVAPWHADATVFLCGPEGLANGAEEVLGVERFGNVLRERFTATVAEVPDTDGGRVTHMRSGVTAQNDGTTLLDGAEAAGLNPQHGCRMGICHTCTAVRLSGATRDLRTGAVDAEPGRRVQICVSAPVGDVDVDL